jgi:hypothetical protein
MRINEVESTGIDIARLSALSDFLSKRAQDTGARRVYDIGAFLTLAQNMQIPLTAGQLRDLSQKPPLSNIIANIEGDDETGKVIFRGGDGDQVAGTQMSVDQARDTVDSMAKRAIDIK